MNKDELLQVGSIASAHGVRGEVNVFPMTDDVNRFKKLKSVIFDTGKELVETKVESVKFTKQFVVLKLDVISDRDQADRMRKHGLYVTRENAVKLSKDEYFIADLIGLSVEDEDGNEIGILHEVIPTGANDVYEVKLSKEYLYKGQIPKDDMVYFPAIKDCVKNVDVEGGKITVHVMDGLIDVM